MTHTVLATGLTQTLLQCQASTSSMGVPSRARPQHCAWECSSFFSRESRGRGSFCTGVARSSPSAMRRPPFQAHPRRARIKCGCIISPYARRSQRPSPALCSANPRGSIRETAPLRRSRLRADASQPGEPLTPRFSPLASGTQVRSKHGRGSPGAHEAAAHSFVRVLFPSLWFALKPGLQTF